MTKAFKLARTESGEQRVVIEWANLRLGHWPELQWLHHIPNVRATEYERMNLARDGVKPGVADLFLPVARGGDHGLYIEMKTEKGKVKPEQKIFIDFVRGQGYRAEICRNADDAIALLEGYLKLPRTMICVDHQPQVEATLGH